LIPDGLLVTVPLPLPSLVTERFQIRMNAAWTDLEPVITTVHWFPATESHPLHASNRQPDRGVGVRVTEDPSSKFAVHVTPQLIPEGELETAPLPSLVTPRSQTLTNVAVAVLALVSVMLHGLPVPESQPLQLSNRDPEPAVALRVIAVP
jgi:hypothetical protein